MRQQHTKTKPGSPASLPAALLIAMVTATGCTNRVKTVASTIPEGIEAVATPAERELREEMRPIRGKTRLLVFAIDGLGRHPMQDILSSGYGPHTHRLLGPAAEQPDVYAHGYLAPETLTILPSSTLAAWTTVFTGESPADTGIPGNEFFLRENEKFYAIVPTSVSSRRQALEAINDGLLNSLIETPTLYEKADLRAHVSLSQVYRGADLFTKSESALLEMVIKTTASAMGSDGEVKRAPYAAIDEDSLDSIRDGWEKHGIPDIQVAYLPGLDLFTHVTANPLGDQRAYYRDVIDPFVNQVLREYERRGVLDDTWIIFISDHGHTPVLPDQEHALEIDDFQEQLENIGYHLRPDGLDIDDKNFTAVLAAQGGLGYLYLANRSRCHKDHYCQWRQPARWREDVRPVVGMLERYNRDPDGLAGSIDAILTRDPQDPDASFQVWENGELHAVEAWLDTNGLDHQVEFARRLRELTDGPYGARVGEILLVPKYGMQYPLEERFYFAHPLTSDHGSGTIEDSRFTLLVAHPKKRGAEIRRVVDEITGGSPRQQHFVPLAMDILGVPDQDRVASTAPDPDPVVDKRKQ